MGFAEQGHGDDHRPRRRPGSSSSRGKARPAPPVRVWRQWKVESISGTMIVLGTFLLVEPFEIRATLLGWLAATARSGEALAVGLAGRLTDGHPSDLVGLVLLGAGGFLVIRRARQSLRNTLRWNHLDHACPQCGGPLKLGHRDERDRLLSRLLGARLRRFKCRKCPWTGLGTALSSAMFPPGRDRGREHGDQPGRDHQQESRADSERHSEERAALPIEGESSRPAPPAPAPEAMTG